MPGKVMKLSGDDTYYKLLTGSPDLMANSDPRNFNDYDVMNASENILQTI